MARPAWPPPITMVSKYSLTGCPPPSTVPLSFTCVRRTVGYRPLWLRPFLEVLVDERDRRRPFADGGGHAFHGEMPHIAGGNHAGDARLQEMGLPLERPGSRQVAVAAAVEVEVAA